MPAGVGGRLREAAIDTLGGAASAASQLPGHVGPALLRVAQESFTQGLRLVAGVSALLALVLASISAVLLRNTAGAAPGDVMRPVDDDDGTAAALAEA